TVSGLKCLPSAAMSAPKEQCEFPTLPEGPLRVCPIPDQRRGFFTPRNRRVGPKSYVRFGSKADIRTATSHVRFTPESDIKCDIGYVLSPLAIPCLSGNRNGLDSLQRGSGAHGRNGRDPAVDQEVCTNNVRRIARREVNCQLRDFQRIARPLAWIVGAEAVLTRLGLLFAWEATEHRRVRRAWA